MPTHGYACKKCKTEFEVFYTSQSAVEREEKAGKCPSCGSKRKRRLPATGVKHELKGPGWYRDGY